MAKSSAAGECWHGEMTTDAVIFAVLETPFSAGIPLRDFRGMGQDGCRTTKLPVALWMGNLMNGWLRAEAGYDGFKYRADL